jgi:hypothetical protein
MSSFLYRDQALYGTKEPTQRPFQESRLVWIERGLLLDFHWTIEAIINRHRINWGLFSRPDRACLGVSAIVHLGLHQVRQVCSFATAHNPPRGQLYATRIVRAA